MRPFEDPTPVVIERGREHAMAKGLQQGRFDSWNPWSGAGAPLWAEQGNPFFPTKLVSFLSPQHGTLMAALAVRLVLVSMGMYLLALALGLSAPVALFVGALLEYSGSASANLPYSNSSAIYVLPWVLLGAQKLCTARNGAAVAISGVALGAALLGGHPSFALLVSLAFGAWILGYVLQHGPTWRELRTLAGLLVVAGLIALLIAAVGLLPFLELVVHGHTYKNAEISEQIWRERLGWTQSVFAMAMVFPSAITATRDTMPYHMWPWAQGASIGLVALLLSVVGARIFRLFWGLALVGVVGVGLTLSPFGLQWLHELPGVRIILPWYCYPLLVLPLCMAAGFGLQILGANARKGLLIVLLGGGLAFAAMVYLMAMPIGWRLQDAANALLEPGLARGVLLGPLPIKESILANWTIFLSPVAGMVAVGVYLFMGRNNLSRAVMALAVLALVEAAAIRIPTVEFERSVVADAPPSAATTRLQELLLDGSWRFTGVPPLEVAGPNSALLFELRDLRSFSALAVRRHAKFIALAGKQSEDPWNHPQWQYPVAIRPAMLALAAVKYVVYTKQYKDDTDVPPILSAMGSTGGVVYFENPLALPRFRIVHDVVPASNEQEAFEALQQVLAAAPVSVPADWAPSTVVEGLAPDKVVGAKAKPGITYNDEFVRRLAEPDPQTIVLEAELASPGFVVVADTLYPGWTATVDGVAAPIFPANLMFRAVAVPAGRHTVVMKYRSSWLGLGSMLSIVGSVMALVIAAGDKFGWRRRSQ